MMNISPSMNAILRKDKTKMDLAAYHHASIFSPVQSTLVNSINNNHFTSWPGLTPSLITKNLPPVLATAKGHLHQEKQNLQSTKISSTYAEQLKKIKANIKKIKLNLPPGKSFRTALEEDIFDDAFPKSDDKNVKTNEVLFKLFETSET